MRWPQWLYRLVPYLALGTGVATARFGIVYGMLIRPLPYPDSERIVRVGLEPRGMPGAPVYLGRRQAEEDLQEELRLHLELERERQRDAGVPEDEVLRAARRTLGNATLIRERTRRLGLALARRPGTGPAPRRPRPRADPRLRGRGGAHPRAGHRRRHRDVRHRLPGGFGLLRANRTRAVLAAAQTALALMLLVGAGLLLRSFASSPSIAATTRPT